MSASLFDIYREDESFEREYKFYVYATDRKDYYLDEIHKTDDRKRLVETIQKWASPTSKKKWAKKHLGDDNVVELTITKGECNWHGDVNLAMERYLEEGTSSAWYDSAENLTVLPDPNQETENSDDSSDLSV